MGLLLKRKVAQASMADLTAPANEVPAATVPDASTELLDATTDAVESSTSMTGKPSSWWSRRREQAQLKGTFDAYPHLIALKPKEKYVFRSDYFEVDGSVACVLAFFHSETANDRFFAFWGIDRIPIGLDDRVTAVLLEQVKRLSDSWIDSNTKQSERLSGMESNEQAVAGTTSTKKKAAKRSSDLDETITELQDGSAYLSVHNRLFLKAPTLEVLEETIEKIARLYIDRLESVKAAPYAGEQRQELSSLFHPNDKKRGKGFHFTSTEFAGSYSLVTNGLNDRGGEYVGFMVGDVNNSAVLMDVNRFEDRVVIADGAVSTYLDRQRIANMWCSKISQATMLNNGKVVHLVLDGADLDKLGPKFERVTSRVDLNSGDVNMFEMFGDPEDELSVFASHIEKLKLMFEQLHENADSSMRSIIRSALEKTATDFYVEQNMWRHNAKDNRKYLRVVGIPHDQVPRLQMFVSYLETAYKAIVNSSKHDPDEMRAYNVLRGLASSMLSTHNALFNNFTDSAIDGVRDSRRVVYDFSRLMRLGDGVAMAQLVNIVGFAVGNLGLGDTVIIHGAEKIDERVKQYLTTQFDHLHERGGRVVFSYNDIDKMLADAEFNKFDAADYTLLGAMRDRTVDTYQRLLGQQIPPDLAKHVTQRGENLTYLRRGVSNIVFHLDLALGTNPNREAQRRKLEQEAKKLKEAKQLEALKTGEHKPGKRLTTNRPGVQSTDSLRDERSQLTVNPTKNTMTLTRRGTRRQTSTEGK